MSATEVGETEEPVKEPVTPMHEDDGEEADGYTEDNPALPPPESDQPEFEESPGPPALPTEVTISDIEAVKAFLQALGDEEIFLALKLTRKLSDNNLTKLAGMLGVQQVDDVSEGMAQAVRHGAFRLLAGLPRVKLASDAAEFCQKAFGDVRQVYENELSRLSLAFAAERRNTFSSTTSTTMSAADSGSEEEFSENGSTTMSFDKDLKIPGDLKKFMLAVTRAMGKWARMPKQCRISTSLFQALIDGEMQKVLDKDFAEAVTHMGETCSASELGQLSVAALMGRAQKLLRQDTAWQYWVKKMNRSSIMSAQFVADAFAEDQEEEISGTWADLAKMLKEGWTNAQLAEKYAKLANSGKGRGGDRGKGKGKDKTQRQKQKDKEQRKKAEKKRRREEAKRKAEQAKKQKTGKEKEGPFPGV